MEAPFDKMKASRNAWLAPVLKKTWRSALHMPGGERVFS